MGVFMVHFKVFTKKGIVYTVVLIQNTLDLFINNFFGYWVAYSSTLSSQVPQEKELLDDIRSLRTIYI